MSLLRIYGPNAVDKSVRLVFLLPDRFFLSLKSVYKRLGTAPIAKSVVNCGNSFHMKTDPHFLHKVGM